MKIVSTEIIISRGDFAQTPTWREIREQVESAVRTADWPEGTGKFIINPTPKMNGVNPLKKKPIE